MAQMTISYKELAIYRIIEIMDREDNTYERPADLLADLLHYCNSQQGVNRGSDTFDEELRVAYNYVDDELAEDAEVADGKDK